MILKLTLVTVLVGDYDEALRWYTESLGFEKRADARYGPGVRWLTVAPPAQKDLEIVLQKPEPALHGEARAREMTQQIGKGTTWGFRVDDCQRTYEELSARGVKFVTPPKREPWGMQAVCEDLYGNRFALVGNK